VSLGKWFTVFLKVMVPLYLRVEQSKEKTVFLIILVYCLFLRIKTV